MKMFSRGKMLALKSFAPVCIHFGTNIHFGNYLNCSKFFVFPCFKHCERRFTEGMHVHSSGYPTG